MTTHRQRAGSPQGPRIYLDTPRASTGTTLTTAYDTRFDTRPRNSFSTVPAARDTLTRNSVYETQPVSQKTYIDAGHKTISRTQYAVRPRRDSDAVDSRRPLGVVTKNVSPTRDRADVVDSPSQMVVYKTPREEGSTSRYLQPAQVRGSPHHQRHSSATRAEIGQFQPRAPHTVRPEKEYVRRGPYVEKVADSRPPPVRYSDDDGFSYTGPREQFARDYPVRPARRESLTRKERPISAVDLRHLEQPVRRDTAPLPAPSRQLDRVERDERKSGFESDPDRSRPERRPRNTPKGPIVHQRDDGYSSAQDYDPRRTSRLRPQDDNETIVGKNRYREPPRELERDRDRDRDRERERERERVRKDYDREDDRPPERDREKGTRRHKEHKDREYERERTRPKEYEPVEEDEPPRRSRRRESSPDRSGLKTLATAAVGGLAAAGIASRKSGKDEEESDSDSRRERKHRRRKSGAPRDEEKPRDVEDAEPPRRRREKKPYRDESSGSETSSEKPRRRPESRTRTRRDTNDGYGSERERERPQQLALPAPDPDKQQPQQRSRELDTNTSQQPQQEPMPDVAPLRTQTDSPTNNEGRTLSPGENLDPRPRKVSIVEPTRKEDFRPRGILKPPREVPFPEDPNPTREGVAPLKQAGKDGIPTGARWTKVSRILVNPEALEKSHERFEERDDYVIVLRVLSREEIEKLAEKTKQIRGKFLLFCPATCADVLRVRVMITNIYD